MTSTGEPLLPRVVWLVLFDGFEELDLFGPVEVFGLSPKRFRLRFIAQSAGIVTAAHGAKVLADCGRDDAPPPDIVLVPGGAGSRVLAHDESFLNWLGGWASEAPVVASVCTGSALLAAAGLLDGYRATSNSRAFGWATGFGPKTQWAPGARWVADGNRWTSAGVSAGIDMTLALAAALCGPATAEEIASRMEYDWAAR
ncbi:MAG: DJ-1/PfpI family protein [Propionibacteriaceae bacterium]|jgi:putative intracellular protease/amidase|nr:DJ-1/PfpI family protein [Propionibacteriaceae bacterium]